jgi:hypothetical protein
VEAQSLHSSPPVLPGAPLPPSPYSVRVVANSIISHTSSHTNDSGTVLALDESNPKVCASPARSLLTFFLLRASWNGHMCSWKPVMTAIINGPPMSVVVLVGGKEQWPECAD